MKKQILSLMVLLLAVFAGTTNALGQDLSYIDLTSNYSCPTPQPLTNCGVGTPLNPVAGVTYPYTVTHTGGTGSTVHWFVADDSKQIITSGAVTAYIDADNGAGQYVLDAEDGVYNNASGSTPNTSPTINISWKAFDATANVILVAFVTDATGCTNNIQAWEITPKYSFILELAGLNENGSVAITSDASECVSPVQGATYNPGTPGSLQMDYGENYIFFVVSAANFIHGWKPTITADATATGGSTVQSVEWAYPDQAGSGGTWNDPASATPTMVMANHYANVSDDAIGSDGACIIVRVLIDHDDNEIATGPASVVLTVDGVMYNSTNNSYDSTFPDLDDATTGVDCQVGSFDTATYDLTPRPNITPDSPTDAFIPKN